MIAIRNETIDRILALVSGVRRTAQHVPPYVRDRALSMVASHCTFPLTVAVLLEIEDELTGAEEVPLLSEDDD